MQTNLCVVSRNRFVCVDAPLAISRPRPPEKERDIVVTWPGANAVTAQVALRTHGRVVV